MLWQSTLAAAADSIGDRMSRLLPSLYYFYYFMCHIFWTFTAKASFRKAVLLLQCLLPACPMIVCFLSISCKNKYFLFYSSERIFILCIFITFINKILLFYTTFAKIKSTCCYDECMNRVCMKTLKNYRF